MTDKPLSLNERFGQPKPLRAVPDPEALAASIAAHPAGRRRGENWARKMLEAQAAELAAMPPRSGRNDELNTVAFNAGRLIPGGWLDEHQIRDLLMHAIITNGLMSEDGQSRCEATLESGLQGGKDKPRDPPIDLSSPSPERDASTSTPAHDPQTGEILTPEAAAAAPVEPLPRLDLALLADRCPPPVWLVEGRMTAQSLTVLGSKPGIGKSWTAYDLAVALTTGRPWLGHAVPEKRRVLYIDVENGENLARRRLQQLGATPELVEDRLYYVTEPVMFPGGKDSTAYAKTLADFKPDLVILDTLASAAPSAEKGTEEASLLLSDIWHRARTAGAACMILAHLRKSQQGAGKDDPLDSLRGAGHLGGAAGVAWILEPRGKHRFAMRTPKDREDLDMPTLRILLTDTPADPGEVVDRWTRLEIDGIEDDEAAETPFVRYQARVLELIDNHPAGVAQVAALLTLGDGEAEKTLRNYLYEMKKTGVIESGGRGHYKRPGDRL